MSLATIRKLRACRLTHAESDPTVFGEIQTRRKPRCRNTSRYTSTRPFPIQIVFDRKSYCHSLLLRLELTRLETILYQPDVFCPAQATTFILHLFMLTDDSFQGKGQFIFEDSLWQSTV